jgi:hypothetical protein
MSIAAEKLPLPHRDVRKKSYCAAAATRWFIKKSYRAAAAMISKKIFQISLQRLYWTRNIGTRPSDSFSLRVFHL